MSRSTPNSMGCLSAVLPIPSFVLLASGPFLVQYLIYANTQDTVEFRVIKAERVEDQSGEGARYLIFTPQETFENTDALAFRKFNSADLHGRIRVGATYQANVAGLRVPFLSWFRNIISIWEVEPRPDATPVPSEAAIPGRRSDSPHRSVGSASGGQ
jgi:hypothetical protein